MIIEVHTKEVSIEQMFELDFFGLSQPMSMHPIVPCSLILFKLFLLGYRRGLSVQTHFICYPLKKIVTCHARIC